MKAVDTSRRRCVSSWTTRQSTTSKQEEVVKSPEKRPSKSSNAPKITASCTRFLTWIHLVIHTPFVTAVAVAATPCASQTSLSITTSSGPTINLSSTRASASPVANAWTSVRPMLSDLAKSYAPRRLSMKPSLKPHLEIRSGQKKSGTAITVSIVRTPSIQAQRHALPTVLPISLFRATSSWLHKENTPRRLS